VLKSPIASADVIFHLVALTITLSIIAHSSTDVVVARAFDQPTEVPVWFGRRPRRGASGRPG